MPLAAMYFDADQLLQYVQQIELSYRQRILEILEPVVGRQNVKAQVTAELDFSQTEATTESHKPNQAPESSTVRSQQIVESAGGSATANATGVPGATTNQPPSRRVRPLTVLPRRLRLRGLRHWQQGKARVHCHYEVDKTVRAVKGASGTIKRLTAAAVAVTTTFRPMTGEDHHQYAAV